MGEPHKALKDLDGAKYFTDRIDPDDKEFYAEAFSPILYTEALAYHAIRRL